MGNVDKAGAVREALPAGSPPPSLTSSAAALLGGRPTLARAAPTAAAASPFAVVTAALIVAAAAAAAAEMPKPPAGAKQAAAGLSVDGHAAAEHMQAVNVYSNAGMLDAGAGLLDLNDHDGDLLSPSNNFLEDGGLSGQVSPSMEPLADGFLGPPSSRPQHLPPHAGAPPAAETPLAQVDPNPPKIRVVVRKRPLNRKEIERADEDIVDVLGPDHMQCQQQNRPSADKPGEKAGKMAEELRNRGSVGHPLSPASPSLWNQLERRSPSVQILKSCSPSVTPLSDTKDPETDSAESLTDSIQARHGDQTDSLHAAESSRRPALSKHSPAPSGSPRPFPTLSHGRMVAGAKSKPSTSRLGRVDTPHPSNQTQCRSSKKRVSPASSDVISKPHSGLGRKKLARKPCAYCGTTDTPQWRQGLNGERNLCNACGVKFRKGHLNHKRLVAGSAAQ
mmetsp:Transcript_37922/g.95947  ORF Transcript_37922/g.95947 Transcript_37922/m.95947 type:complete len:448 (-) Transcript_37922:265-1608(-)